MIAEEFIQTQLEYYMMLIYVYIAAYKYIHTLTHYLPTYTNTLSLSPSLSLCC